jgi:SAM-dependent methyltransferase
MAHLWQTHLGTQNPFDAAYHANPRVEITSFLRDAPGTVLDIGCGGGSTGRLVKEKFPGTRVIGVEINAAAAEHAQRILDRVIRAGIDDVDPARDLDGETISTVLLLDVLEHLYDPWRALQRINGWLAPGTRVIASVPNVRNLHTMSELAGGRFEYAQNGVLDITHVRFFTRTSVRSMFEQTGFVVEALDPLTQPEFIDEIVVHRQPGRLVTRTMSVGYASFEELEDLYAMQYVVDARSAPRTAI